VLTDDSTQIGCILVVLKQKLILDDRASEEFKVFDRKRQSHLDGVKYRPSLEYFVGVEKL